VVGTVLILRFLRSTSVPMGAKPALPDTRNPYPEIIRGCLFDGVTRLIFACWAIITIEEGGTLRT